MRRSALVTAAVLGGLVSLLGGTVLYSALQDTARTGTNSAESAAIGGSADIQLATATVPIQGGAITCGTFFENLTSGLFAVTAASPGSDSQELFCVKNVGSQPVALSTLADELTDVDFACTGDEEASGDACGGDQAGELSSVLTVGYAEAICEDFGGVGTAPVILKTHATTPYALGTLAAGATKCYATRLTYPASTANADVQKAQSDRATWRVKFTAQA